MLIGGKMENFELKYYNELSKNFKSKKHVLAEIINLKAIMNLPKGTEHFVSDIHGEFEMFLHILKTASGVIRRKIDEEFGRSLTVDERASLACLIYYPQEKMNQIDKTDDWYRITLYRLTRVASCVSAKYTRSKVRKMLPKNFDYIMDELLNCDSTSINKEKYYSEIIDNIISLNLAGDFFIEICSLIQNLAIDHLHIVGDIFDRGPRADIIMDYLKDVRGLDIEWGNHDILWIGAGLGDPGCILSVLVDCFKYNNLELLEDGYNINLLPVYNLVSKHYLSSPNDSYTTNYNNDELASLLKAVSILRYKVEDNYRRKYKSFNMEDQTVLDKINFENKTWNGYAMNDCDFPTVDHEDTSKLTKCEEEVLEKLIHSFVSSRKLQKHVKFLLDKGSIYLCYNGNLMFHGCIPLDENGEFLPVKFGDKEYKGKAYMDYCDDMVRRAYKSKDPDDAAFIWQLWCGNKSPVFGKDKMTTFERIYINDHKAHKEVKQHYFNMQDCESVCDMIFDEFGLDKKRAHIINGHIPVKHAKGESPIKANGKMIVIDGGMSKPYQKVTGIAGYTLTYHSYGMVIASHQAFLGKDAMVESNKDVLSAKYVVSRYNDRITVKDTDNGKNIQSLVDDLTNLYKLYNDGIIKDSE